MTKIFSVFVFIALLVGFVGVTKVSAADQVFPVGCSSAIGSSVTTGAPCNGTTTATQLSVGCSSAIGYSTMTGVPCSGTGTALTYLGGCTSTAGYSTSTGAPCNGTSIATSISTNPTTGVTTTPGLPTTGGSGAPLNIALLVASGILAVAGATFLVRRSLAVR